MSRRLPITLLVASWFLSGWSLIPPMVQEAHAAVAFKNVSALFTENDNTGTTLQVDFSTNVEGDFLIGVVSVSNASTNPAVDFLAETGWTLMTRTYWNSVTAGRTAVYYRFAPAGGISQQIFDSDATTGYVSRGFVYTGVDTSTPIDVGPVFNDNVAAAATHTPTGADTATANAMFITVFSRDGAPVTINNSTDYTERTETGDAGPGDGTLIHWQERLIVSAGTENPGAITWTTNQESCSMSFALREVQNASPGEPTIYDVDSVQLCFNNAKINDDTPTFRVAATDDDGDDVVYTIDIDDDPAFGSVNWTEEFTNGGSYFTSGTQTNLTMATLTGIVNNTTYFVQARAKDPDGSNAYGSNSSGTYSFTYSSTAGDLMWHQTTDEQFDSGTLNSTAVDGSGQVVLGPAIEATGGTITESGGYTIHTFTSSGTFEVTAGSGNVEVLVVAGGAGGGTGGTAGRGGGGAGGLVYDAAYAVVVDTYTVTVGAGSAGASSTSTKSLNGGNSVFNDLTALGGGGAGIHATAGADGGSGGGGNGYLGELGGSATQPGSASGGFGNDGGASYNGGAAPGRQGGGGGTGAVGQDGQSGSGGNGGVGLEFSQFSSVGGSPAGWFGGGGGGGASSGTPAGSGGQGGGGAGGSGVVGGAGTANTGGGGGGSTTTGGSGGSGIIIVRYPDSGPSSGTITSPSIDYDSFDGAMDWDELLFTDVETNGTISYDVEYWNGSWVDTPITNQGSSPVDISSLDPVTHNQIRIEATLTEGTGTPYLQDWTVTIFSGDKDGDLTSAAGVTEPVAISSIADTEGERVAVFDFTISDGGTSDALTLGVSQIVLNTSGTGTFSDLTWQLNGPDVSYVTGTVAAGTITFGSLSISVADGGSEVYTVYVYFSTSPASTDNQTFILSVDGDTDLTVVPGGTWMGTTSPEDNGTGSTMDVVHSQIIFSTQPPAAAVVDADFAGTIAVTATDVNGNVDEDFNENITISAVKDSDKSPGSGTLSSTDPGGLTKTPSSGTATWTDTKYSTAETIDIKAVSATTYTTGIYSTAVSLGVDADGDLTSAAGPVPISSIADTVGERVAVFDFTISDGGTSDAATLDISQIRLNTSGTGTFSDLTWQLNGPDVSYVTGSVAAGTITFGSLSISVADGGSEVYTVYAYFSTSPTSTDNQTFILSVDGDTDLTVVPGGTQMGSTTAEDNGTGSTMNVVHTQIIFSTQPPAVATTDTDFAGTIAVTATDINGNVDEDFSEDITLSAVKDSDKTPGTGILSSTDAGGLTKTPTAGVATWTDTKYDTEEVIDVKAVSATTYTTGTYSTAVTVLALPGSPTLYSTGGAAQLSFNNAKQNTTTPRFRASATCTTDFNRFYIELNTQADFAGTAYTQTFSGTYVSGTQYNLLCNSLSTALPTTDGVTYYVRSKASSDAESNWGGWSSGTWSFTYSGASGDLAWHQTTDEQFDTGTLSGTQTDAPSDRVKLGNNTLSSIVTLTGTTDTDAATVVNFSGGTALNKMFHFCSFSYDVTDGQHYQTFKASELTATDTLTIRAGAASGMNALTYRAYIVIFTADSDLVVQRSNVQTTSETTNYTLNPTLSALSRSFVIPHGETDPSDTTIGSEEIWEYQLTGTGTNGLQVIVDAANNSSGGNNVYFEVVDWGNDDITVQHINDNTMTTSETTDQVDITAVDRSKTWLIGTATWEGVAAVGSPTDDAAVRIDFVDDDTVQLRKQNSGVQIEWSVQVIEDTSDAIWDVDADTVSMAGTENSDTVTIGSVDTDRTFVNGTTMTGFAYTGQSNDGTTSNVDTVNATVTLTNATTITAARGVNDTYTLDIPVQAVEFLTHSITSPSIDYDSFVDAADWDELLFTDVETNGTISYDVEYWDGDSWEDTSITNQTSSPVDISSLDPVTHNQIRIEATLTGGTDTPYLQDWTVSTDIVSAPTLYSTGGSEQLSFNNAKQNTTTPRFRASATCATDFNRFYIELNTQADFGGTSYTQTFSGTYTSGTQYNLLCNSLSSGLPTTDGVTYYVRSKASADGGSNWGGWSSGTWSFTYNATAGAGPMWFQTTDEQFDTGTLSGTQTDAPNDRVKTRADWLAGWDQRIKLTIDSAGSKVDADLSDFPVLAYLSTSSGITSADVSAVFDELTADANRKKIAVTKSDGTTECYVEIEKWDDASEDAWLWVKVAGSNSISSSADTVLYLYYDADHADNTTYVGDSGSRTEVWDNNFMMVQHMEETSGTHTDSSGNGMTGTNQGTTQNATGKIDGANDFGSGDYIDITDDGTLDLTDAVTVEVWASSTGVRWGNLFSNTENADVWLDGYILWFDSNTEVRFHVNDYQANVATSAITSGNTNYIVGTYDKDAGSNEVKVYVNSVLGTSASETAVISYDAAAEPTMSDAGTNNQHVGIIDEVRISNIARSAAWIETSYYSEDDNLITFGSEEISASPGIDYDSFVGATDWDWVKIKQDETNGDIKYTVQYLSGTWQNTSITDQDGEVLGGYNYIDISSLTPATHNEIRIVATFTYSGGTPYLQDWTVFALGAGPTIVDLVSLEAIGYFGKVLVEWETDSEINNAGFNVFRSEHPHYGFNKLNSALIAGLGSSTIGKEYRFWDDNVTDGITYYYLLEDVELEGKSTLHGPIQAHPGLDSDGDGMTNDWENYYSLNPYDPADAPLDADADDLTNLEEFIQGKNPTVSDIPTSPGDPDVPAPPPGADKDGIKIIPSDDYGVVLELITPSFETETRVIEDETYHVIKLPFPHGQTSEAGKPQIPVKGMLLGIPFDSAITFNLVSYEKEILSGYNLYPVPRIQRERNFSNKRFFKEGKIPGELTYEFFKDTNTYSQDVFYPDCLAEISPVGSLRGQGAAKLNIYPIQFNPVTGELEFYKRIRLEVDFGKKAEIDQENIHKPSTLFDELYKRLFYNYSDVKSWKHRSRRYTQPDNFAPDSAYKISVNEEGIYRLTWQDLLYSAGLNPYWLDPRKIKIYHRGNQIPIYVEGQRDGWFDCDDYIEFYAEAVNTRFTTTNIYWLVTDGSRGQRMETKRSSGRRGQTPTSFLSDIHHEENRMYWMDIPDMGYVDDHWFFGDSLWAPCSVDFVIPLSDVAEVEKEATLKIALQGVSHGFSGPDHHTYIYLNGHLVDDATWDGDTEYIRQLNVPQSYFLEGDNFITIALPGDTGAEFDSVLANWFEVSYWRQLKAKENALKFNTQGRGRYSYKISNFTENDIEIFDITNPQKVECIVRSVIKKESGSYTVDFKDILSRETNKDYLVLSSSGMKSPVSIVKDEPSNLRFRGNQADYIIITHEDFYDGILPLAEHRAEQGLSVKVVKVQDIYDEFNYGIFSPEAIKTFLKYTYSEWTGPAPTYVLLVGDGTYDYQDNEGLGCINYVPTYMVHSLEFGETGCDNWFVCLDGEDDVLPDMFIGRLPVYTSEQLNTIVSKTINYETAPSGDWTKNVTLVADNLEGIFVTISEGLYLPSEYETNKIYLDNYALAANCKTDIIDAINQGTLILNYVGHGSVIRWAKESILTIPDILSLNNLDRLPFIATMTCGNGYFVYPPGYFNCIAEELLYSPSGGAVAILAPTGVSYPDIQELLDKYLFESIFVEGSCLGVAITQARLSVFENAGQSGENVIQTFPLFGDPALELKR